MVSLQRAILIATALVIAGLALYPPFNTTDEHGGSPFHRGWVFAPLNDNPPADSGVTTADLEYLSNNPKSASQFYKYFGYLPREVVDNVQFIRVDLSRLMAEWLGTLLVGGLLWFAARPSSRASDARPGRDVDPLPVATASAPTRVTSPGPLPVEPQPAPMPTPPEPTDTSPESYAKLGREAAKRFDPLSWQVVVGALLMAFNIKVRLDIYPVSPAWAYGLWALTAPYFAWMMAGCPPYRSRRAREYRRHCEQLDRQAIEQKIAYEDGMTECQEWRITAKQRESVLDEVYERKSMSGS